MNIFPYDVGPLNPSKLQRSNDVKNCGSNFFWENPPPIISNWMEVWDFCVVCPQTDLELRDILRTTGQITDDKSILK